MSSPALVENPRSCWGTPDNLFRLCHLKHHYNLDGAANADNAKVDRYITREQDAFQYIAKPGDRIWLNPPYSGRKYGEQPLMAWAQLAVRWRDQGADHVSLLAPCDVSTQWFAFAVEQCNEARALAPRVEFVPPPGVTNPGSPGSPALFIFNHSPAKRPGIHLWKWAEEYALRVEAGELKV